MNIDDKQIFSLLKVIQNIHGWKEATIGQKAVKDPRIFTRLRRGKVYTETKVALYEAMKKL